MKQFLYGNFIGGRGAWGLLALRVMIGLGLMTHGWEKIQKPFSWLPAEANVPGGFQFLAAFSEFFGGMAFVLGLLTPLAALGVATTMLVAIFMVHGHDPAVAMQGGRSKEPALLYLTPAILLFLAGPGAVSIDAILFNRQKRLATTSR